ncbi:MAG: hypothetical protein K6A89_01295 [Treponema sp.]|nr:hypothetical protein [Treponema sp.]
MINYRGTPLFGEDSSVSHTSEFFAIAGTIVFWLIFLIFSFVIKPQPKKQYKEVQIVLSSTPVVQKIEEAPAPAEAASASASAASTASPEPVVETPVVETPAPQTKKAETPKTSTQSSKPAPQKKVSEPVEQVLYQDPMEAFAQQTKQQSKKEFDWSQFDEDEAEEASIQNQVKTVQNNEPAFSGSAGTAASTESAKITSSSSSSNSKSDTASSSTSNALQGIRNTTFKGNAVNGVQSETSAKTKESGSGKVEMEMSNGRSRALISPASPVINLSAPAAATIDASITVSISFKVNEKGNVSGVTITPSSAFKDIVKQEITGQLLEWIFEPADYTATATFEYKIVKR